MQFEFLGHARNVVPLIGEIFSRLSKFLLTLRKFSHKMRGVLTGGGHVLQNQSQRNNTYLQIVENKREGKKTGQRAVATLGRLACDLRAARQPDRLADSLRKSWR